jgi:hypothetical protein
MIRRLPIALLVVTLLLAWDPLAGSGQSTGKGSKRPGLLLRSEG